MVRGQVQVRVLALRLPIVVVLVLVVVRERHHREIQIHSQAASLRNDAVMKRLLCQHSHNTLRHVDVRSHHHSVYRQHHHRYRYR